MKGTGGEPHAPRAPIAPLAGPARSVVLAPRAGVAPARFARAAASRPILGRAAHRHSDGAAAVPTPASSLSSSTAGSSSTGWRTGSSARARFHESEGSTVAAQRARRADRLSSASSALGRRAWRGTCPAAAPIRRAPGIPRTANRRPRTSGDGRARRSVENPYRAGDSGVPNGIRTRVTAVKGRCPRPLDDGDVSETGVAWV
jgi:hypothetical protein